MSDGRAALAAWRAAIGSEHVVTDELELRAVERATFETRQHVPAILRPATRLEVQECLRIASQFATPVYPFSRGKNWGYGSRVPVEDCVLVDLSRMNRIVEFDEDLAYITVEPGVTAVQVYDFLRSRGSNLMLSRWGVTPDASLIGTAVERGFAVGPYSDRFDCVAGLQVVLADGSVVHSGYARYANAKAAAVHRWGVGPAIDGLFTQSNLGIVTRMSVWLAPKPADFRAVWVSLPQRDDIGGLVDALRSLILSRAIEPGFFISNDYRRFPTARQYPFAEAGGLTPMPAELARAWRAQDQRGAWDAFVPIYASSPAEGQARTKTIRAALAPYVDQMLTWNRTRKRVGRFLVRPARWLGFNLAEGTTDLIEDVFVHGRPAQLSDVIQTYWRKREPMPADPDPDRDHCGVLWCAPILPAQGALVRTTTALVASILSEHGFEPAMTVRFASARSVAIVTGVTFDRDVPGEDARARQCHDQVLARLAEQGIYPHRLGIKDMSALPPASDDHAQFLAKIKTALDPARVLAPGRYEFAAAAEPPIIDGLRSA